MRLLTLLLAGTVGLLACSGDDDGPSGGNPPPPENGDEGITVGNNFFDPNQFTATVGTPVVWTWAPGAITHNVTFEDGADGSGEKSSGTFSRTFTAPGTYPYLCSIHGPAMSGTVTVAASSSGGSGGGGSGGGGSGGGGGYDGY